MDARSYLVGAQILASLGAVRVRLISNNPAKRSDLEKCGIEVVARIALPTAATEHNLHYLRTKREQLNHDLVLEEATD